MSRLLALFLALCAVLPTAAWARVAEACHEPDRCACRRADAAAADGPVARRFDCCASPCDADVPPSSATPVRSDVFAGVAAAQTFTLPAVPRASTMDVTRPRTRTRGPPRAVYSLVAHRLL